jgi:hypothetical protein
MTIQNHMQKILSSVLVFMASISTALALGTGDRLDLAITPIRVDVTAIAGQSTTGSVTLYNNSDQPYSFRMSAEDCTATTDYRAPICTPADTGSLSIVSLASWITFDDTTLFTIAPKSKRTIGYIIHTPISAVPGGHYGAVFFNSPDGSHGGTISMNRRIGSLLLVTVPGNIIVAPEFGSILVDTHGGAWPSSNNLGPNFWKLSQSEPLIDQIKVKWQALMMIFTDPEQFQPIVDAINPFWTIPTLESAPNIDVNSPKTSVTTNITPDPIISLGLPVDNRGTIHIIPEGKITLHTADGAQLTRIGKELIKNENGAIVGEKIVDYLTINEENGNVLPNTNRTFMMNWYGFARESIGDDGKVSISYETPSQHYSRIAREESGYLYPWDKLALTHISRALTARVDLSYMDPVTKTIVSRNYDLPMSLESDEIVKGYNTGLLTPIILIALIWWWIAIWRRRRYHYNSHETLIWEDGDDEIAVLERARAVMFAKEATRAATAIKKKPITKNTTSQKSITKTTVVVEVAKSSAKKPVAKKSITTEKVTSTKKTVPKKTPVVVPKEVA